MEDVRPDDDGEVSRVHLVHIGVLRHAAEEVHQVLEQPEVQQRNGDTKKGDISGERERKEVLDMKKKKATSLQKALNGGRASVLVGIRGLNC